MCALNSSEHRCDVPGCGDTLVLDGNMKNNREVCSAKLAGYSEFSGLPGRIQTGCPNTPVPKSRYCPLHAPAAAVPHNCQFSEDGNPVLPEQTSREERPAAIILRKRVTRQSTFYQVNLHDCNTFKLTYRFLLCVHNLQVVWLGKAETESTWEPESSLPKVLVANYEAGVVSEVQRETFVTGGQTVHTLTTTKTTGSETESNSKRPRMDQSETVSDPSG